MKIQCDCGKFKAELDNFSSSPGRLVCYCDDCQDYLKKLNRIDILDAFGGTQVIPVYPNDFKFLSGNENLKCNIIKTKGLNRWSVTCCNFPIANTMAKFPWIGIPHKAFTNADSSCLEKIGPIRSRIKGKFKTSDAPFNISDNLNFKDIYVVLPFILKGFVFGKFKQSPFFEKDGITPISEPQLI